MKYLKQFENNNSEIHTIMEINPYSTNYTHIFKTKEDCIKFFLYFIYEKLEEEEIGFEEFESEVDLDNIEDLEKYYNELSNDIKYEYNISHFQEYELDDWMKDRIDVIKKAKNYNL